MEIRGAELGIALNIRPVDVHIGQSLISLLCPSGGMADTSDLKSDVFLRRAGSSPASGTSSTNGSQCRKTHLDQPR